VTWAVASVPGTSLTSSDALEIIGISSGFGSADSAFKDLSDSMIVP